MNKHPSELRGSNVCVLTPAVSFTPSYVESFFGLLKSLPNSGINVDFMTCAGSHVGQLREKILNDYFFSSTSYDFCFWIDSDISFTVEDFIELMCSPYEVTAGVYLISQDGRTSVSVDGKHLTFDNIKNSPKYINVDASGLGFMCIKNNLFNTVKAPYFSNVLKSDGVTVETSEDSAWCERVRQNNFDIACNTKVRLGHQKPSVWSISDVH
jgi:hypothetical protein